MALFYACTGLTDIILVYPLAVIATRREAGMAMVAALKQGRFWAGGWTAGSLLIPYSIVVEGVFSSPAGYILYTTRIYGSIF